MAARPWLEVLKERSNRRDQRPETRDVIFADTLDNELPKLTKAPAPFTSLNTVRPPWDEDQRRLLAARWTPKDHCGPKELAIWANPDTGFYYSQEIALHCLGQSVGGRA